MFTSTERTNFLLTNHLGSTAVTATSGGGWYSELRYYPWGGTRYSSGTTPTSYRYTGQREAEVGLYYYGARFYDPSLGRFISPDSIIPNPGDPVSYDRFAYVRNNPLKYIDPSGHDPCDENYNCYGRQGRYKATRSGSTSSYSQRADSNGDGEISYSEAEAFFVINLQDPGNGLSVTGRFGGQCTMEGCSGHHPGVDFVGEYSITATSNGIVVEVDTNATGDFGMKVVVLSDVFGYSFYSIYAHLDSTAENLEPGVEISAGASIGIMGSTPVNESWFLHLHYEVRTEANVILDAHGKYLSLTTSATSYWADSLDDMHLNWVDLGPRFGYSTQWPP